MKKFNVLVLLFGAIILVLSFSCSSDGSSCDNAGKNVITTAEELCPLTESPLFGTLPSIAEQKLKAESLLDSTFRAIENKLMEEYKDDKEAKTKKYEEIVVKKKTAEKELEVYYQQKMNDAAAKIIGKEIPCETASRIYKDAKVKMLKVEDFVVICEATITYNVPGNSPSRTLLRYRFLDKEGKPAVYGENTTYNMNKEPADGPQITELRLVMRPTLKDVVKLRFQYDVYE